MMKLYLINIFMQIISDISKHAEIEPKKNKKIFL